MAVDDATRLAYVEVLPDEQAVTCVRFLWHVLAWFRRLGIRVRRLMTDNGSGNVAHVFAAACQGAQLRHVRTRPYTPGTNGKAERFIRGIRRSAGTAGWRTSPTVRVRIADVGRNRLTRIVPNGHDVTQHIGEELRQPRRGCGLFGVTATMDPRRSGAVLAQSYWFFRADPVVAITSSRCRGPEGPATQRRKSCQLASERRVDAMTIHRK